MGSGRPEDEIEAQKLMVLGRLAGGVAHDFNNQLTSILGYADLVLHELDGDDQARQDLLEIRRAAERAHVVTRQLLGFDRPHPADPVIIRVADALVSNTHLLKRVLGEAIQLVITIDPRAIDREPGLVRMDPGHLGQLLLCLGARARQTLPHGGTFTIAVANVEGLEAPTPDATYVRIAVTTANGGGERETSSPASPTLGLPIVDAIVRQGGGELRVDRTPSGDERVMVHLPRVDLSSADADIVESAPPRGVEQILIVEDDAGVRELLRSILQRYGYEVRLAERPSQALVLAESPETRLDLAIVDVILPEQRGDALARELTTRQPGMRVLYMSGHSEDEIGPLAPAEPGPLPNGTRSFFLRKPFTPGELLITVRQALDSLPPAVDDAATT